MPTEDLTYLNKDPEFKFGLGDRVQDVVTGFKGIVTARTQWLNQCNTYSVKSQKLKDNVPIASTGFDEPQLKLVEVEAVTPAKNRTTGGSKPIPSRPV